MQRYTIIFIALNALPVSSGVSARHQELKLYIQHLVYVKLAYSANSPTLTVAASKFDIYQMLYISLSS